MRTFCERAVFGSIRGPQDSLCLRMKEVECLTLVKTGSRMCEVEVSTVGSSTVIDPRTTYYQFGRSACALGMNLKILHIYRTHIHHELNDEKGGTYEADDAQCIDYVTADHVISNQAT
jgi:hypothetical protein